MGCGRTLFLAEGGHVTCSSLRCPRPTVVDELLDDRESEHLVLFDAAGFTIRHPLHERLGDALMICPLHSDIQGSSGPPVAPGRYRAVRVADGWVWQISRGVS
ncbi:(2Fe-2S)-binding protein [Spongiactinospora rosea]|uniref:(2Fe-2S)-binding protein n=2 Tax=Spongiactinospora rosea TaxID=2248750 RepID=A0A366M5T5_9ACTN|nr:(2Fe-2S)-binding protein [Spongiactinospora rosea]